jgi:hypothetical protein
MKRRNEYLQWSTNVTSDTDDSGKIEYLQVWSCHIKLTEFLGEEWLEDWLQVKADEAGIRIGNDFSKLFKH